MLEELHAIFEEKRTGIPSKYLHRSEESISSIREKVLSKFKKGLSPKKTSSKSSIQETFLEGLQKDKEERKARLRKLESSSLKKIKEAKEIEEELNRQEKERVQRLKRQKIAKSQQELAVFQEKRKEDIHKSNKQFQEVLKKTPLHQKISSDFFERFELPELQKKKEILAEKRKFMGPINMDELENHAKRYKFDIQGRKLKKNKEIRSAKVTLAAHNASMKFYSPKVKLILDSEEKTANEKARLKQKFKQNLIKRQKQYGEIVREVFKPTVSPSKQIKLPKQIHRNSHLSGKTFDYLQNRRSLRELVRQSSHTDLIKLDWKDIVDDTDTPVRQKLDKLQQVTKKHEIKLQNYEYLYDDMEPQFSFNTNEAIANGYLQSIQAKLALLSNIK